MVRVSSYSSLNLRLARAGNGTVGAASGHGRSVRLLLTGRRGRSHFISGHVNNRLLSSVATGATGLSSLVVGDDVEGNEQNEVGGEDAHSSEGSEFLTGAVASVGSPGEVGGCKVGVRRKVNED